MTLNPKKKLLVSLISLFILWVLIALISIFVGTYDLNPLQALLSGDELSKTIYFKIRIPNYEKIKFQSFFCCLEDDQYEYR